MGNIAETPYTRWLPPIYSHHLAYVTEVLNKMLHTGCIGTNWRWIIKRLKVVVSLWPQSIYLFHFISCPFLMLFICPFTNTTTTTTTNTTTNNHIETENDHTCSQTSQVLNSNPSFKCSVIVIHCVWWKWEKINFKRDGKGRFFLSGISKSLWYYGRVTTKMLLCHN